MRLSLVIGLIYLLSEIALTLRNWGAMLVVLVPIFTAFIHRMNVEEQASRGALGQRYEAVHAQDETPNPWRLLRVPRALERPKKTPSAQRPTPNIE